MPSTPAEPLSSYVQSWSPAARLDTDSLPEGPVAALSAVLDLPGPAAVAGDPLPPLWHWLYFLHWPAQHELGPDGHPLHGHFLPPVPDRQRMFAGGRCIVHRPLHVGEPVQRISSLVSVTAKKGRTGELLFVTQRSEFLQQGTPCLVEEQDIVYRSGRGAGATHDITPVGAGRPAAEDPWQLHLRPDAPLLFRFSALTANAHRIHYDVPYARDQEGYPGLVVHGPLLALLMLELARRNTPRRMVRSLGYRLRRPVFAGEPLLASGTQTGDQAALRIGTHREPRHATAEVIFA